MPSHPINRNANQTKATVLEAAISGLFSKIAARFGPADKQGTVSRRQVRNGGASLLLAYNLSVDLLEHFHLPVIDPLHDAVVNGTASDITDGASASEVADLRGANLTTESMSAVNAGDASNSTLVDQRNSSKNVAKSFLLDLENDSNQTAPNPTVVVVPQQSLTATPMQMRCPHCGHEIMTHTKKTVGLCTYIMVGVCCFFCMRSLSLELETPRMGEETAEREEDFRIASSARFSSESPNPEGRVPGTVTPSAGDPLRRP
ncbi:hypothetical protein HPB51_015966 [Rhipicephalus microplus]|uniref:LITAF domain-containing protein n=1 Tax=Rhipicephalus microplus TaxID=6941 RepID=A0A9J6DHU2_RHIMP|nr:hypothetical protein HPB51_015966 [Rhipicephalus microplus]